MSSSYQHYPQQPQTPQQLHSPKQQQQQPSNQLPITPQQVVEKMSFSPLGQQQQHGACSGVGSSSSGGAGGGADAAAGKAKAWQPVVPPPAASPPPPPCRRSSVENSSPIESSSYPYHDNNNKCDDDHHQRHCEEKELDDRLSNVPAIYGQYGYYQTMATAMATTSTLYTKGNSSGGASSASNRAEHQSLRSAPFPSITNFGYQEEDGSGVGDLSGSRTYSSSLPVGSSTTMRGDASLRPNTGQTNDAWGGIGSLTEIASQLRWYTVGTCVTAVLWEGFAFPSRLLIETWVFPAKTVLGGYLAVFCILFLGVDLGWKLQDTIGILYHPLGRGFLLLFMASMCFGILASWWESLLGIAFLGCGGMYIYAYCSYPEYRRWQSYEENTMWQDVKDAMKQRSHGWADPDAVVSVANMAWNRAAAASGGGGNASEQQSLLNPV
jgi:hypothetical protein